MSLGTNITRTGQATQPGALVEDAALVQQADKYNETRATGGGHFEKKGGLLSKIGLHAALVAVAVLLSLPFVYMIATSLKPLGEVSEPNWVVQNPDYVAVGGVGQPLEWLPFSFKMPANYFNVFNTDNPDINNRGIPFGKFFRNSIFVACWVTFLQVVTSSMAAYSFARLKWTGRDKVFLLYLTTMMLPGLVMMIPNYQIMIQLGLVDTLPGLIIPAAFSAFGTFLLRQFMLGIPGSLDEAAEIDGASKFRIFWDIILPLARPGIVTLTIFTFMGNYNSFFWPLVMLRTEERYTLPVGLLFFDSSRGQSTHLMMAAVTMSVVPMILVFVLLQKQLVKGIQLGAVKG